MTTRTIAVVSAGLSQPSSTRLLADQLAAATRAALATHDIDATVTVIELRDHAHEIVDHMLTGFPGGDLAAAIKDVAGADGLIVVTPTFNASYSGLFKSFFDVLPADDETGEALAGKPVLIAATGGTARHSLTLEHALRPMFAYLRAVVVPTAVYAASADWGAAGGKDGLGGRIDRAAGELAALVRSRPDDGPADPFDDPTSFEDLLAG
jgi:FMN reductase